MNADEFVQARVLRGVGKFSRHVKIKNLAGANLDALRYDIRQRWSSMPGRTVNA